MYNQPVGPFVLEAIQSAEEAIQSLIVIHVNRCAMLLQKDRGGPWHMTQFPFPQVLILHTSDPRMKWGPEWKRTHPQSAESSYCIPVLGETSEGDRDGERGEWGGLR